VSTTPEANTKITLYNYQKQPIGTVTTDASGLATVTPDGYAVFAVAQKGANYAYLKIEDGNALSMSKFDISGKQLQKGLKGFIYAERGVHRPGDSIHLSFVLNDANNPLPKDHPVKLEVTDARGKLTYRKVLSTNTASQNGTGKAVNNVYYFPVTTTPTAPTGNWNATISVGGASFSKTLKVETIKPNRLKVNLAFENEIISASDNIEGSVKVAWLHGAPARNLKIKTDATIRSSNSGFKGYPNYNFFDPIRSFDQFDLTILDGQLNEEGVTQINKELDLGKRAPGMLKATFVTKAYEGGGDFSLDVVSKDVAPFDHFVGLQSPKGRAYGSYFTDDNTEFDVVTTDTQGKVSGNRTLEVKVFKMSWRWWWSRGRDNYSRYETGTIHTPVKDFKVTTGGNGKTSFTVNIPERESGRYLIRVIDPESGHATGRIAYFYRNWSGLQSDSESAKMLVFSSDKEKYQVGDDATITFPSGDSSRALVSIENGTTVKVSEANAKAMTYTIAVVDEGLLDLTMRLEEVMPLRLLKTEKQNDLNQWLRI